MGIIKNMRIIKIILLVGLILVPYKSVWAATLTKTTVYVNINKQSILGHQSEFNLQSKFKITITNSTYNYTTTKGTDDTAEGYLRYSINIDRCGLPAIAQELWNIEIKSTDSAINYSKTIAGASLCGNPIYTIKADGTTYINNGRSCSSCPTTTADGDNEDKNNDTENTEKDPEPINVGFYGKVETVDKPFWAPNCDKDGKHTDGILEGVPCNEVIDSKEEVVRIVKNIISVYLLPIVGVLFITVIVIGGLAYITSSGNKERVDRAKKILTSGIIGLLIVTLSYTIIQIFAKILGGNVG